MKQHVSMPPHVVIRATEIPPGKSALWFDKALVITLYTKPKIVLHVSSFHGAE